MPEFRARIAYPNSSTIMFLINYSVSQTQSSMAGKQVFSSNFVVCKNEWWDLFVDNLVWLMPSTPTFDIAIPVISIWHHGSVFAQFRFHEI